MARTKDELRSLLRLQHEDVIRRGKPRLGNVTSDTVELLVDLNPTPGALWWECQQKTTLGTVLEGRASGSGGTLKVGSTPDEMEADVRRVDALVHAINVAYRQVFQQARDELAALTQSSKSEDPEAIKRRLQRRLNRL